MVLAPHRLDHFRRAGTIAAPLPHGLCQHEIALAHLGRIVVDQDQVILDLAVHRLDPRFAPALAHDAEDTVGALPQALDQTGFQIAALQPLRSAPATLSPSPGAPALASSRFGARRMGFRSSVLAGRT